MGACVDRMPPRIDGCPSTQLDINTLPGRSYGVLQLSHPGFARLKLIDNGDATIDTSALNQDLPLGRTALTISATDSDGNQARPCTFDVVVSDLEAPSLVCPLATVMLVASPGADNGPAMFDITATDNIEIAFYSISPARLFSACVGTSSLEIKCSCRPGDTNCLFPVGVTAVTLTANDTAANAMACSFDVVVVDRQPPAVTCPSDVYVQSTFVQLPKTVCRTDEYETVPYNASLKQDRVCTPISVCKEGMFELVWPTKTSDRGCESLDVCTQAQFVVVSAGGGSFMCRPHSVCTAGEYQAVAASATADRQCRQLTSCIDVEEEDIAPTATSDRVCRRVVATCLGVDTGAPVFVPVNDLRYGTSSCPAFDIGNRALSHLPTNCACTQTVETTGKTFINFYSGPQTSSACAQMLCGSWKMSECRWRGRVVSKGVFRGPTLYLQSDELELCPRVCHPSCDECDGSTASDCVSCKGQGTVSFLQASTGMCHSITVCAEGESELAPPTTTSDRVCGQSPLTCNLIQEGIPTFLPPLTCAGDGRDGVTPAPLFDISRRGFVTEDDVTADCKCVKSTGEVNAYRGPTLATDCAQLMCSDFDFVRCLFQGTQVGVLSQRNDTAASFLVPR